MNLTGHQLISALNIDLSDTDVLSKIQQRRAELNISYQQASEQIYSEIITERIRKLVDKIEQPRHIYLKDIVDVLFNNQSLIIHYKEENIYASTPSIKVLDTYDDMWLMPISNINSKDDILEIWLKEA